MKERIILTIVCILGSLIVAGVAWESMDKTVVFFTTFGIIETVALCSYNYLENGIFWFWGMTTAMRRSKRYQDSMRKRIYKQ